MKSNGGKSTVKKGTLEFKGCEVDWAELKCCAVNVSEMGGALRSEVTG